MGCDDMDYQPLLQEIVERYTDILSDNLIGIYCHGSIVFGCFNWDKSDIDFIVVVNHELSQKTKLELLEVLETLRKQAPPKGFEMSVVLRKYCSNFEYPTPYELHFSNGCLKCYLENALILCGNDFKTDYDLAAHFTVIKQIGIALCGLPIADVFGNIPKENYINSIQLDIQEAKTDISDNPVYVILNLCRVLAFIKDNVILSKEQGGQWGLLHLPKQYYEIVNCALSSYTSKTTMELNKERALDYSNYMLGQIF